MSGAEIIEQIQALPETERIKVLQLVEEVFEDELDRMAADTALQRNDFVDWDLGKQELTRP